MGYCAECGNKLDDGVSFCDQCGTAVEKTPSEKTPSEKTSSEKVPAENHSESKIREEKLNLKQNDKSKEEKNNLDIAKKAKKSITAHTVFSWIVWVFSILLIILFVQYLQAYIARRGYADNYSSHPESYWETVKGWDGVTRSVERTKPLWESSTYKNKMSVENKKEANFTLVAVIDLGLLLITLILDIVASTRASKARKEGLCPFCESKDLYNNNGYCTNCNKKAKQVLFDNRIRALHIILLCTYLYLAGMYLYNQARNISDLMSLFGYIKNLGGFIKTYIIQIGLYILFLPLILKVYMYPHRISQKTEHVATKAIFVILIIDIFIPFPVNVIVWGIILLWASLGKNQSVVLKQNQLQTEQMVEKIISAQAQNSSTQVQNSTAPSEMKVTDQLVELKKLFDAGILTEEEFCDKKKQLLEKI